MNCSQSSSRQRLAYPIAANSLLLSTHLIHSRVYLPNWQAFPVVPRVSSLKRDLAFQTLYLFTYCLPVFSMNSTQDPPYNYDWLTATFPDALYFCLETHRTVLSEAYLLPQP